MFFSRPAAACSPRFPARKARVLAAALALMPAMPVVAAFSQDLRMEPQPFRQAQVIEGRDFDYNAESFIHRASFAPSRPIAVGAMPEDRIVGTGGSSRSDELFLDMAIQVTHDFSESTHFQYRFRRTEDFDGRYDRNLIGIGFHYNDYIQARLMADVTADKAFTDLQPEISWRPMERLTMTAAVVWTERLFNSKQNEDRYRNAPETWFLGTHWQPNDRHGFRAYINATPRVALEVGDHTLFRDRNGRVGAAWDWTPATGHHWQWLAEAEATDRDSRPLGTTDEETMSRRFWRTRFEYSNYGLNLLDLRMGGQFLFLRERGDFDETPTLMAAAEELSDRQEWMAFIGTGWSVAPAWTFTPTIYAVLVEGESVERAEPADPPKELDGFYAKVTLPFTWQPQGAEGARLTLNPTFRLHRTAFGGGNLNISIPL